MIKTIIATILVIIAITGNHYLKPQTASAEEVQAFYDKIIEESEPKPICIYGYIDSAEVVVAKAGN